MRVFTKPAPGVNATAAPERPHDRDPGADLDAHRGDGTHGRRPTRPRCIGVWTTASRQQVRLCDDRQRPERQQRPVPGLAARQPALQRGARPARAEGLLEHAAAVRRQRFASNVAHPELAGLLPGALPGRVPEPGGADKSGAARADLVAILLTGHPDRHRPGLPELHRPGAGRHAPAEHGDPAEPKTPNILGLVGGDLAGFPNGRRVFDDVVTIELRAIAGVTYPLVDQDLHPRRGGGRWSPTADRPGVPDGYLSHFPYLGVPHGGFSTPS